jgi:uncharacterized membrane protein YfcA
MKNGRSLDFNKEIVFGEIGALLGSALGGYLSFWISRNESLIPTFAVVGSLLGSTTLFLSTKIYDKKKRKELSFRNIFNDLKYYTPAAAVLRVLIGSPLLYFLTRLFVESNFGAFYSGALGEFLCFLVFLTLINFYRIVLARSFKIKI